MHIRRYPIVHGAPLTTCVWLTYCIIQVGGTALRGDETYDPDEYFVSRRAGINAQELYSVALVTCLWLTCCIIQIGGTVLHGAAWNGQIVLVEYLVSRGADIHARDKVSIIHH